MNKFRIFILVITFIFSQSALSDDKSRIEAEALLDSIGMQTALEQSIEQMLQIQLQQNPALVPYKNVMLEFFSKYMSYESLKPKMIDLYAKEFTASELKEINNFYATPTGRKTLEKMPRLMAQGGQIGAQSVQDNMQELENMIKAQSERIQMLQGQ